MKKFTLIISLFLSSCASMPDWFMYPQGLPIAKYQTMSVQEIELRMTKERDSFDKTMSYSSPFIHGKSADYYFRGFTISNDRSNTVYHQLIFSIDYYGKWRFYKHARDSKKTFKVTVIDREVTSCSGGSCGNSETLGVTLTTKYLKANRKGFKIRLSGKRGADIYATLPANYIQAYLNTIN